MSSRGETYAIPLVWPDPASSRFTSLVMSSTVRDGSAEAIEYGTSTLVTPEPCIGCALRFRRTGCLFSPNRTRSVSCGGHFPRKAEVDVLPGHLDLTKVVETEGSEAAQDGGDELLGCRGACREADGLVPGEQVGIEAALAVDQPCRCSVALGHLHEAACVRAGLRPDHEYQG